MTFKTRKEIAEEYGISERTLRRWIKKIDLNISSGLLSPKEQNLIYEAFGFQKSGRVVDGEVELIKQVI